jgi:hypothetical protein
MVPPRETPEGEQGHLMRQTGVETTPSRSELWRRHRAERKRMSIIAHSLIEDHLDVREWLHLVLV